ncbi:MAG: YCII-related protein [Solirubrobacterales bacterium]|nr:YCII-related protein [Solirubrobacterales bacterium]
MRFMMFMYPNMEIVGDWEPPGAEDVGKMAKFNEQLTKAGVLLSLDGLHPPSEGARVRSTGGKVGVTDGPFAEAKEVVGGYWLIQAKSKEEAVEWASRCPLGEGDFIEVRRVYEMSDFPEDVQAAAELSQVPPEQTSA